MDVRGSCGKTRSFVRYLTSACGRNRGEEPQGFLA